MPIINNVSLAWVKCDPEAPVQYKGQGPYKWSVQVSTGDKKVSESWTKEFGMKMTPFEGSDGKIQYKTTLSAYAYAKDDGSGTTKKNRAITVMLMNGDLIDPNTIGNGSIGNVSFYLSEDKETRRLKGIQVRKLIKYEGSSDDKFELSDDFEIIESQSANSEEDPF